MKIKPKDIGRIASDFLALLNREKIEGVVDLEMLAGKQYPVEGRNFVSIESRPSNLSTMAYTVEYCIPLVGNIISLKINTDLVYMQSILRSVSDVSGYQKWVVFGITSNKSVVDRFGNKVQYKYFKGTCDFSLLKRELKGLSELT